LAHPDDILCLIGHVLSERRGLHAGDQLRIRKESGLQGPSLDPRNLRLADGKLRMETIGKRQGVGQGQTFKTLGRIWFRRCLGMRA
jgi:hypothetical protein